MGFYQKSARCAAVEIATYVLIHGGWSFFQRALDAELAERILFSARLGAIHYLGYTLSQGGNPSRDLLRVRQVFTLE